MLGPSALGGKNQKAAAAKALIAACGWKEAEAINLADVAEAVNAILAVGHMPTTQHNYLSALRQWLRLLVCHGAPNDLAAAVPRIAKPSARERTVTPNDLALLLDLAQPWMQVALLLMHDCGLRSGTMLRVSRSHIDGDTIAIRTKRGQVARVPISPRLRTALVAAPRGAAPIVPTMRGGKFGTLSRYVWAQEWRKFIASAGIEGLRPHDLRRTMARKVYQLTGDLRVVQQLLGHAGLMSTVHYLGSAGGEAALRDAVTEASR